MTVFIQKFLIFQLLQAELVIRQATVNWVSNAGENAINIATDDTQQRPR